MEDALAFGGMCISLLNHADRVKTACLAQLVNAIAPIMTQTGGPAWRQTIFHPFAHISRLGCGRVLRAQVECDGYDADYFDPRGALDQYFPLRGVPIVKCAAVADAAGGLTLFALCRELAQAVEIDVDLRGFGPLRVAEAHVLHDGDLNACNTRDAPERVTPKALAGCTVEGARLRATLRPASWNVVRLAVE